VVFIIQEKSHSHANGKIDDLVHMTLLYDFYGELLGEHKKRIFEDYIVNDLSLGEIADETGISRQGVHDVIRRSGVKLREYEEKLHLVEKFMAIKAKTDEINMLANGMRTSKDDKEIDRIFEISKEILDEL